MVEIHVSPDWKVFRYPMKPESYSGDQPIKHNEILSYCAGTRLSNGWMSYNIKEETLEALENDAAFLKVMRRIDATERANVQRDVALHPLHGENSARIGMLGKQAGQVWCKGLYYFTAFAAVALMVLTIVSGCTPRY